MLFNSILAVIAVKKQQKQRLHAEDTLKIVICSIMQFNGSFSSSSN